MRNYCKSITRYEGSKSDRIMSMINDLMRKKEQPKLKEYVKDKELVGLTKEYLESKKRTGDLKQKLQKRKDELGIEWYSGKYSIAMCCRVPPKDYHDLQRASNLHSIGKYVEARKIWDRIIKKYNIIA